jgi:RNA polymerase sigma-70 factor (ECF subfamily)
MVLEMQPMQPRSAVDLSLEEESTLVMQVARADAAALEELYNRYSRPVYSMAFSLLRDQSIAEDVSQEVFLALWRRAGRFDPERGVFRHWFLHLAHNRIIDEIRKRKRVSLHSADKTPEDVEYLLASPANTADQAITAVMFGAAAEALKGLPEAQRTALVMAYLQGATQQEIAERTGVPLGTVKTRLRLGLIKLREQLSQPAGEEA